MKRSSPLPLKLFVAAGAAVLWFGVLSASPADAAVPTIGLLNPTSDAVLYLNTPTLFEVQITTGDPGTYTIDWQTQWDGITDQFPDVPDHSATLTLGQYDFPASGLNHPNELRYQPTLTGSVGQKHVRVRVTMGSDSPIAAGKYYLVESLTLSGYTWSGAASPICMGGSNDRNPCTDDSSCPGGKCGNDAFGWTSYSCANENTVCQSIKNYGVRIGKATGGLPYTSLLDNSWIGDPSGAPVSVGWMTFNRGYCTGGTNSGGYCTVGADCPGSNTCTPLGTPPMSEIEQWDTRATASYLYTGVQDFATEKRYPDQVSGWARLLKIAEYGKTFNPTYEWGWVHLRGAEASTPYTPMTADGFHRCVDCSANGAKCNICQKVQQSPGDPESAWKQYGCNSCYGCDGSGICDTCQRCDSYGVSYDPQKGTLVGFGWGGAGNESGIGWTQFNPTLGGVGVLQAWIATRYGDIFAGGDITKTSPLPSPPGTFNATYVIQANGTIQFSSEAGYLQPNYPTQIKLPTAENQYINVLGRLDLPELTKVGQNRYGTTIVTSQDDVNGWGSKLLDGKIYWVQGDLTINEPIEFQPGPLNQSGAGTVIIDGDLRINDTIRYNTSTTIGRIINLPSVTWIVRGNLDISPNLGSTGSDTTPNIVGAYIVVGCPGDGSVPCGSNPKDGIISTGASNTLQLIVNGLMMAKAYHFERNVPSQRGSEQVIYDGRLIANPPPGLQDLTAVLPVIREVTP